MTMIQAFINTMEAYVKADRIANLLRKWKVVGSAMDAVHMGSYLLPLMDKIKGREDEFVLFMLSVSLSVRGKESYKEITEHITKSMDYFNAVNGKGVNTHV